MTPVGVVVTTRGRERVNLYFLLLLNQHKQSSLKIHVIFLENLVTKKLHHTEEWTGPLMKKLFLEGSRFF